MVGLSRGLGVGAGQAVRRLTRIEKHLGFAERT